MVTTERWITIYLFSFKEEFARYGAQDQEKNLWYEPRTHYVVQIHANGMWVHSPYDQQRFRSPDSYDNNTAVQDERKITAKYIKRLPSVTLMLAMLLHLFNTWGKAQFELTLLERMNS